MPLPLPRLPGLVLGVALALAATAAPCAEGQTSRKGGAVAELTSVQGEVTVIDATGHEAEARQVGGRVRRGSLGRGDTVRTGAGSGAVLAFDDGSELKLGSATELTVRLVDLTDLVAAGQGGKPLARRLVLAGGEIEGLVKANPEVSTELKGAGGVVTLVAGALAFSATPDQARLQCTAGEVTFRHAEAGLTLQLPSGYAVGLERRSQDRWQLTVDGANPGPLPIRLANGKRLAAEPGTRMTARVDGHAIELRIDRGRAVPISGS